MVIGMLSPYYCVQLIPSAAQPHYTPPAWPWEIVKFTATLLSVAVVWYICFAICLISRWFEYVSGATDVLD